MKLPWFTVSNKYFLVVAFGRERKRYVHVAILGKHPAGLCAVEVSREKGGRQEKGEEAGAGHHKLKVHSNV